MDAVGANRQHTGFFVPGRNCWRIERAHRLAFLIDAAPYYAAVRAAIARAKRSVFILAWDFNTRTRLVPPGANDGYPEALGEFLKEVVRRQRQLQVHVLSWDFAMVFARDREWLPLYKLGWRKHPAPGFHFRFDNTHPLGASHHQKVVVVDDAVAFVGGLDLTHGRWDTPAHRRDEPYRLDARGRQARPNHDVQAIVDAAAARALGELCRDRWQRATGRPMAPVDIPPDSDPWPRGVVPEITDVDVAIARTDPGYVNRKPVEEIRHLYIDAIASAKRALYFENQYFSSSVVGAALAARLHEHDAPEVVVVSRLTEEGWLEERTMGALRAHLHAQLQQADVRNRYRLFYPRIPELEPPNLLNVHSKVLIVDDEMCSVGSANFSNRSMAFDTECNIAIEAKGEERVRRAIAGLRSRLLAEHLDTSPEAVAAETARQRGSLIATIGALRRAGRTLEPINPAPSVQLDRLLPVATFIDPERPAYPDVLAEQLVPPAARKSVAARIARLVTALLVLAGVAAAWRWTPLQDWVALDLLLRSARAVAGSPVATLAVLALYAAAGLLVVPITLLIVATAIVFDPFLAGVYAFAGALLNAAVTYWAGRRLGRNTLRRLAGSWIAPGIENVTSKGMLAIAGTRLVPVAPFPIVNAVAGASRMELRQFLFGTALGVAPGIAIAVIFVDQVRAAITHPEPGTFTVLAGVVAVVVWATFFVLRRFRT